MIPDAWLIRKIKNGEATVLAGHVFKSEATAQAAALRLTNQWRVCIAFPVVAAGMDWKAQAEAAESTNATLLARVGELEKGLKEFCDGHCVFSDNNPPMITSVMDAVNGPTYVTYGTRMNKARALLQSKPEGEGT